MKEASSTPLSVTKLGESTNQLLPKCLQQNVDFKDTITKCYGVPVLATK